MKQVLCIFILLITINCFSQQTDTTIVNRVIDQQEKGRRVKTIGIVLTVAGAGVLVGGVLHDINDVRTDNNTSPVVYAVGGAMVAGGVTLMIVGRKTSKNGPATAVLKMDSRDIYINATKRKLVYPALAMRVMLR